MAFIMQGLPGRPGEKGSPGEPVSPSSLTEFTIPLLLKLKSRDGRSDWDERGIKLACENGFVPEWKILQYREVRTYQVPNVR